MKLILAFLVTLLINESITKELKKYHENHNRDETTLIREREHLDMRGTFRKEFFVHGVLSNPDQSTVCSPISALMPLGKLALGADGNSLEELLEAVGVSRKSMISRHFKPLIEDLRDLPGVKLDIANKLYVSTNTHLHRKFTDQARDIFESSVEKMDFAYPTYTSEQINSWVYSQTNGKITKMLSPGDITPSTSVILINAVYFNGRWKYKFDKVTSGKFHTPRGEKTVDMMTKKAAYNYTKSEALGAELIKIPYVGDKASFLLVLPTSRTGLPTLLSQLKLAPEILDSAIGRMEAAEIQLTMPKFKIESELDLNEIYKKIGVKKIFSTNDSGLSKIARDETLHVSKAKQKVFVEVNEFGTEAAASTGMDTEIDFIFLPDDDEAKKVMILAVYLSIITAKGFVESLKIKANRPFLFIILARGQQLFSGTLVNPK